MRRGSARWWLGVAVAAAMAAGCDDADEDAPTRGVGRQATIQPVAAAAPSAPPLAGELRQGRPPPEGHRARPRFRPPRDDDPTGLRALPDGNLEEWGDATWEREPRPLEADPSVSAELALASYGSGISVAVRVSDDSHQNAQAVSAFPQSDHVELELWPHRRPDSERWQDAVIGTRVRLGTLRQLVEVRRPSAESWRAEAISAAGVATAPGKYQVEARLPFSVLTPSPAARVKRLHYRVTVWDADGDDDAARAALRFSGSREMVPPLMVPEAVQRRGSVRACMATQQGAMWGYSHGWRCVVPVRERVLRRDDLQPAQQVSVAVARVPEPVKIVWIRERLLFINMLGAARGAAALFDDKHQLLSVMDLGVVGASDPGNARAHESDAEWIVLPDGSYAVAVTHSYRARPGRLGGRCAGGHRIFLSILALRHCLKSTPHKPAPPPPEDPFVEEVFRAVLEDCAEGVANDWSLSRDRRTIKVHSSLYPTRSPRVWTYRDGRYRLSGPED